MYREILASARSLCWTHLRLHIWNPWPTCSIPYVVIGFYVFISYLMGIFSMYMMHWPVLFDISAPLIWKKCVEFATYRNQHVRARCTPHKRDLYRKYFKLLRCLSWDCRDTGDRREVYGGLPYLRAVFSFTSIIPNSYVAHFLFEHVTRPWAPHRHVLHPSVAGNLCPTL